MAISQGNGHELTDVGTVRLSISYGSDAFARDDIGVVTAGILRDAARQVRDGNHSFPVMDADGNPVGKFEFHEQPSLDKDGVVDLKAALDAGRVYVADDSFAGIADGEFRYVVTTPDFTPGYHQGEGEAWLVNAKGEKASGYDDPQTVREVNFRDLKSDELSALSDVVQGRMTLDEFERSLSGDDDDLSPS